MASPVKTNWVAGEQILAADLNNLATHTVPTGTITLWPTGSAPTDFLLCDGSAVSRTTYSALFSTIGTTFGSGDGSTTFNVPDTRGREPLGKTLHVATAGTSTTSNTIVETNLLSMTIAAEDWAVGSTIHIHAAGAQGSTTGGVVTYRLKLGGTEISANSFNDNVGAAWAVNASIVCRTIGAAGSIQTTSSATARGQANNAEASNQADTVANNGSLLLKVTGQFNNADVANGFSQTNFIVTRFGAAFSVNHIIKI